MKIRSESIFLRRFLRIALAGALAALAPAPLALAEEAPIVAPPESPVTKPEGMAADPDLGAESVRLPVGLPDGWYASIETSLGTIVARLLPDQAPQSVAWFVGLANGRVEWPDPLSGEERKEPYYDGLAVTKSVAADRFEAGERTEVGRNTPPLFVPMEGAGPVNFSKPGRLGRIRSALNHISAVKFFVSAGTLSFLNGVAPCFGEVVVGQEVVERIAEVRTNPGGMPLEPVTIRRIRVAKVGNPSPLPQRVRHEPKGDLLAPRPDMKSPDR